MPLEKDNPKHRDWSNTLDEKYGDNKAYTHVVRPIVHGAYHAARYADGGFNNEAEWSRAKDQFSRIGTGQNQTEYLKAHQQQQQQQQQK